MFPTDVVSEKTFLQKTLPPRLAAHDVIRLRATLMTWPVAGCDKTVNKPELINFGSGDADFHGVSSGGVLIIYQ
jgi:hypothetical protein